MKKIRKYQFVGVAVIVLIAIFASHKTTGLSGLENGRFSLIQSLSEQGVFFVENSDFRSVDSVVIGTHSYSDKPPFASWTAALLCRMAMNFGMPDFSEDQRLAVYLVNFVFGALVNSLIFWWLFNIFRRVKYGSAGLKFILALNCVVGTWILSYGTMFNNHSFAALALTGLLSVMLKFERVPSKELALISGLCAGWVGLYELPMGLFAGICAVTAAAMISKKFDTVKWVVIGGALAAAGFFMLNFYAYQRFMPLYTAGSYSVPQLVRADSLNYIFDVLFYSRGIFSYQPLLFLAVPGVILMWKKYSVSEKAMVLSAAAAVIFYILFTDEYGGWAYGFRYYIPLIPVLSYLAGRWILLWKWNTAKLFLLVILMMWGVTTASVGAFSPYCVAFEGHRSPANHFTRSIRSTFAGNLMTMIFLTAPDSALMKRFEACCGSKNVEHHLKWSLVNLDLKSERLGLVGSRSENIAKLIGVSLQSTAK